MWCDHIPHFISQPLLSLRSCLFGSRKSHCELSLPRSLTLSQFHMSRAHFLFTFLKIGRFPYRIYVSTYSTSMWQSENENAKLKITFKKQFLKSQKQTQMNCKCKDELKRQCFFGWLKIVCFNKSNPQLWRWAIVMQYVPHLS